MSAHVREAPFPSRHRHRAHGGLVLRAVGRISFADPRAQAHVIEAFYPAAGQQKPDAWSEVFFDPYEGRLLLFPAWLYHQVEPNLAEGEGEAADRVSISFNLFQRRQGLESHPERGPIVLGDLPEV